VNWTAKLGLSVVAGIAANLLAWQITIFMITTLVYLQADNGRFLGVNPVGFILSGIGPSIFSLPPGLIFGLPLQALLQWLGGRGLLPHISVALIVGWPVGVICHMFAFTDKPLTSLTMQDVGAQFSYGRKIGPEHLMIPLFLILASCIFWFIRRPDKDVTKALP